jgi:NADH dehydrogenase
VVSELTEAGDVHAVTGAFGFTGRYITHRLLDRGVRVITLTNRGGGASPLADRVEARPFDFDDPDALAQTLAGVSVLYNTYWVRFDWVARAMNGRLAIRGR